MKTSIQQLFDQIELQRQQLLTSLAYLPEPVLSTPPSEKKWSILQILTHLYISEKLSIGYIKKKSLGISELTNAGFWQSFIMVVLKISQRIPVRYKAPKAVLQNTPEAMALSDLIAQWNLLRIELKALLENLPEEHIHKLVYKHPIGGRLSLPQAMDFFSEHIIHHKPQIKRILKKEI